MATTSLTIRDLPKFRQFVWDLRLLIDDMRVGASPYAERLEHALDRFTDGEQDALDEEPV